MGGSSRRAATNGLAGKLSKLSKLAVLPDIPIFGAFLLRLVVAVAISTLLLPLVGPMLDHHFAERQPGHAHIYLGERVVEHVHPYALVHYHHHTQLPNHPSTGSGNPEGIVYMTSDYAASPGSISLIAVSLNTEMAFPEFGDSPLLIGLADPDHPLTESFLTVPERPPLA